METGKALTGMRCNRGTSRVLAAFVAGAAALLAGAHSADAAAMARAVVIGTFNNPVYVTAAPDTPRLLFVVEQRGIIRVLQNEVTLPRAFLDIRSIVRFEGERGLLSMAFAPDYATSRRFYVAFTNVLGDVEIDEFQRSVDSARTADPGTRRILLTIPHREASNHNGGQLQFGPDGYLYISVGDGGNVSPRGEYARDLNSLLGKILRISPLHNGSRPYAIPPDNPYVGTGFRREIYAYGLRNPWRFTFDRLGMAIADVGQGRQEEINFLEVADVKGMNFGWPQFEGNLVFDNARPGPDPATFPMFVYDHTNGGCAVIGGYVARDPRVPALRGRLIYGDLCIGDIRSFIPDVAGQRANSDRPTGISAPGLSSFGKGLDNVIYFTQTSGAVSKIIAP